MDMTSSVIPPTNQDVYELEANLSALFFLLQRSRRRQVIWYLTSVSQGEQVTVRELSEQIAAVEKHASSDALSDPRRTVYSNLDQNHLSPLSEANVIQYDADRKLVAPGPTHDAFAVLLATSASVTSLLLATDISSVVPTPGPMFKS